MNQFEVFSWKKNIYKIIFLVSRVSIYLYFAKIFNCTLQLIDTIKKNVCEEQKLYLNLKLN